MIFYALVGIYVWMGGCFRERIHGISPVEVLGEYDEDIRSARINSLVRRCNADDDYFYVINKQFIIINNLKSMLDN